MPFGERMTLVLSRPFALVQDDSTGAVIYSRSDFDIGQVAAPPKTTVNTVGGLFWQVRGRTISGASSIDGDKLAVHALVVQKATAFEVYHAGTDEYHFPVR